MDDGYREAEERIQKAREDEAVSLDLSRLGLTAVPSEIVQLTMLEKLNLSRNRLMDVPPEITQLTTLQWLHLGNDYSDGNEISELPPEIGQLTALQTLKLDNIGLTAIPPEIGLLTGLTKLRLDRNELTAVPPEIGQLAELRELNLGINELTAVPPEIGLLTALRELNLSRNELTAVPPEIGQLTDLRKLYLGGNGLTTVPPEIGLLTGLRELDLGANRLTAVSPEIGLLTGLRELNIGNNNLTIVPPVITQLINLQELVLYNTQITTLSPEFFQLTKLTYLHLGRNQIETFSPEFSQLTNLTYLHLGDSQLTAVPPAITQLSNLRKLILGKNQLTNLPPEFVQLTNLIWLSLDGNQLTAVPPEVIRLTNLTTLWLDDNKLTAISPEVAQLTNLTKLRLENNQLTIIPKWLVQMPQLEKLYIFNNPITQPPPELLGKALTVAVASDDGAVVDLEAVRRYYAQLAKEGEAYFYEAKLLLIGEGGAGKTSLAQKLLNTANPLPPPEDSTKGIDILHWQFPVPTNPQPPIPNPPPYIANIWDFGGQSIYKNTHQFFLSKRSVYILLTDTRRESGDFYDWLRMQETFGNDSPVLLLKNKNRSHGNECIIENLPHLRERFPNLKEVVEIDLNNVPNEKGWNPLLGHLQEHLLALDHIGQPRPKTWVAVRHALDNDGRDSISRRQFLTLCAEHGIADKDNALQLSDYLHHVGDILHFQDDPVLNELIILNTTWALDAVYRVLDNKAIIADYGRFTLHQLQALWHEAKYDNHRHHLLRLMENFRLCYKLNNLTDTYIAPQLLQTEAPAYEWDEEDNLQLRYRYPLFMPRGILSRAIVALHHRIEDQRLTWRFGAVLRDKFARAELLELRGEGEIRIRVSGKLKRDLLMEIVRALEELHSSFSAKLQYEKLIPCNCETCAPSDKPYFFRLDKLLEKLSHGKTTVDCDNYPYTEMQIPHLIGDIIPQAKAGDNYMLVGGDYINVGNIQDAHGVALGRKASASTTQS